MSTASSTQIIRVKSLENVAEPSGNENVSQHLREEYVAEPSREKKKEGKEQSLTSSLSKSNDKNNNNEQENLDANHTDADGVNYSSAELSVIPHRKGIKIFNLLRIKRRGYMFYEELMTKYNSSLYKLRMNTDRILMNDHMSISVMYDTESVRKEQGFGFMNYNALMLRNYVPAIFSNGKEHSVKKDTVMLYIKFALSKLKLQDINNMVAVEFKNMPVFDNLTSRQSKKVDFEDIFDKAVGNVVTKILLGSSIGHQILEEWLSKTLEFEYGVDLTDEDEIKITNTVFDKVKACPHIKQLPNILSSATLQQSEALREIIWMTTFNAFGGTKSFVISSLISFLTLNSQEKNLIIDEAEKLLSKKEPTFEDLRRMGNINSFFLEVARLFPPAATVYGRTTKDLLITSTTGKYFVPRDNLLCGNLMAVHRDKNIFDNPNNFSLRRPEKLVTRHNYTFGGRFYQEPSQENHKCPGKDLAEIIVKLFTVYITQCNIIPTERPQFTGKNMGRFEGSDRPLRIKSFRYMGQ